MRRVTAALSSSSNSAVMAGWSLTPKRRPLTGSRSRGGLPGAVTVSVRSPRKATATSMGPMA